MIVCLVLAYVFTCFYATFGETTLLKATLGSRLTLTLSISLEPLEQV